MARDVYNEIWKLVQELTPDEQLELIGEIAELVRLHQIASRPQHSILEFRGLGKEVWEKIDVDQYLEEERNSWDREEELH